MAGYRQPSQAQEFTGEAQIAALTAAAASQLMASRIEKKGAELTGITVVLPLGGKNYLRAKVPDDALQAFKQKLASLPAAEKGAFAAAWMAKLEESVYGEYSRVHAADPKKMFFNYPIPPLEMPASAPAVLVQPKVLPTPSRVEAPPGASGKAQGVPPLPKEITGEGTAKSPYEFDITGRSTATDRAGSTNLVMPIQFDVGLNRPVYFRYTLTCSQVRQMVGEARDAPFIQEIKLMTSNAIARAAAVQGVPFEGDIIYRTEDGVKQFAGKLASLVRRVDDAEIRKYFGR